MSAIVIECRRYWHGLNGDSPGSGFLILKNVNKIAPKILDGIPGFRISPLAGLEVGELAVVFDVEVVKLEVTGLEVVESEVTGSEIAALETVWSGSIVRCLQFLLSLVVGVSTQ